VIGKRSSVIRGTLTIDDLNRYLDEITENIGKQENQSRILQKIYNRATPDEQRWIIRIILKGGYIVVSRRFRMLTLIYKDMNISVKDTTVFGVFHPDAQDLYNTCSDLKKVAWGLWDPNKRLGDEVYCDNPRPRIALMIRRVKESTCFGPLRRCFAGDQSNLRKASEKCKETPSSSKRSLTESACNCTSVVKSSSIARGEFVIIWVFLKCLSSTQ
jgi:hypothetical protein